MPGTLTANNSASAFWVSEAVSSLKKTSTFTATIRAGTQHRTPDAIHLATATLRNADVFLTADRRLKSYRVLRVLDVLRVRP